MNVAGQRNIGVYLSSLMAKDNEAITAGAGNDGVEVSGNYVDRTGYLSGKLIISFLAVLDEDETLSVAANMQDASDGAGTGVADYGDALANAIVATGGTGGTTERGTVELDVDLSSADAFVRPQMIADLSRANTDTVNISAVLVVGGHHQNPQ